MNVTTLIGNLGEDPEIKKTQAGKAVANLRVCTNRTWLSADGEEKKSDEWHNVVVWGFQADGLGQSGARKGTRVIVAGRLTSRSYEDRDGAKRYVTEVVVDGPDAAIGIVPRSDDRQGDRTERTTPRPSAGNAGRLSRPSRDA
jgi:single-strand DNA-binding protein